jgi:hypothetical protein
LSNFDDVGDKTGVRFLFFLPDSLCLLVALPGHLQKKKEDEEHLNEEKEPRLQIYINAFGLSFFLPYHHSLTLIMI